MERQPKLSAALMPRDGAVLEHLLIRRSCKKKYRILWNASLVNGYTIEASGGRVGTVQDLLFVDLNWVIRWLVVNPGDNTDHKILLPVSTLGVPDVSLRQFPVNLTPQQVRNSPDVETDFPVSRQIEEALYDFYGWASYWRNSGSLLSNSVVKPFVIPLQILEQTPAAALSGGDPNLRSVAVVAQYNIHALDGNIGHIDDFFVLDENWFICYIIVDTKNWRPGEKVSVSPDAMQEINWEEKTFYLSINRRKMKDSPLYDPVSTEDGAYDDAFLKYFGINRIKKCTS